MDLSTREDLSRLLRPLSPTFSFRSCLLIAVRVDVCPAVAGPPNNNNNNKRHSSLYVSVMLKKERISLLSKFLSFFFVVVVVVPAALFRRLAGNRDVIACDAQESAAHTTQVLILCGGRDVCTVRYTFYVCGGESIEAEAELSSSFQTRFARLCGCKRRPRHPSIRPSTSQADWPPTPPPPPPPASVNLAFKSDSLNEFSLLLCSAR